jgi:hypothetical protein
VLVCGEESRRGGEGKSVDLRFIQCPAGQGAAEGDQWLFDDLAAQFLPARFFVEICVVVEGGGWGRGVEIAGDGHSVCVCVGCVVSFDVLGDFAVIEG